jgi:diketogulonate reductase-like aldo/keto reductase
VFPYDIVGTWKVMESFVKEGLVKDIGISNFSIPKIETLLKEATIIPAVHQVHLSQHPAVES